MGQVRVSGSYCERICLPNNYEDADIIGIPNDFWQIVWDCYSPETEFLEKTRFLI